MGWGGGTSVPTGSIVMTARSTSPDGWLLCNGAAINRTGVNATLFDTIGTAFGIGDGSTTFNLPDLRARFPIGVNGTYALAATGGTVSANLAHTHDIGTLANTAEAAHTHSVTSNVSVTDHASHTHTVTPNSAGTSYTNLAGTTPALPTAATTGGPSAILTHSVTNNAVTSGAGSSHTHTLSGTVASASSATQDITPPYIALNYIIKQ